MNAPSPDSLGAEDFPAESTPLGQPRPYLWLATVMLGYIGIYLCRKNLSVALPMLQQDFGISKSQAGIVASASTVAYAAGKFIFGPVIDRMGGRICFFASLLGVALFGAAGAFVSTLGALTVVYSGNRLAGSASWGSMVKMIPEWFKERSLPLAMAWLSLSFVFGGVCATLVAGKIAAWSGNSWRAVMGFPSILLLIILLVNVFILPKPQKSKSSIQKSKEGFRISQFAVLARIPQFWIVCSLSFTMTLMRETFNTWTVDFIKTEGGAAVSNSVAAFLSIPFDACGALGILALGWIFGRVTKRVRTRILVGLLLFLTVMIYKLPSFFHSGLWAVTVALGLIGFAAYGPYSLLAGILSVEIRGKEYVATVAGMVDGFGYLAGILAGQYFGGIVDRGGYPLGFKALSGLTLISAALCLFLYPRNPNGCDLKCVK